jgi:Zn-dependent peptidase ImmA (M78 family)
MNSGVRPFSIIREHQKSYPVDLEGLARDFHIPVLYKGLDNAWSGVIGKSDGGFFIIVNRNHSETRQRFTIAHEIAHYILHRNQIGDGIKDDWKYRSRVSDADEGAANKLASEILIPADLLGQAVADVMGSPGLDPGAYMNEQHLEAIAEKMKVSTTTLAIRLGIPV